MQAKRQSRHLSKEELITSLLLQGLDDQLQLWWLIGEIAIDYLGLSPADQDAQAVMGPTLEVIGELLEPGYFLAGDAVLDEDGAYYRIRPWGWDTPATIKRIEKEWRELPEPPTLGDVVWLELTDAGREEALRRGSFPRQSA
jgi:hypothetical protein